jgi:hypothetical protein
MRVESKSEGGSERYPDWMGIGVHWKLLCLSGQDWDTLSLRFL